MTVGARDGAALLPHQVKVFRDGHRSFLNKGTGGRWRGVFRPEDLALYEAKLKAALAPECAEWLERGGAVSKAGPMPEVGMKPQPE